MEIYYFVSEPLNWELARWESALLNQASYDTPELLNKTPMDACGTPPNALLVMETTPKPLKQSMLLSILSNAP